MSFRKLNRFIIRNFRKAEFLYRTDPQDAMQCLVRVCFALRIISNTKIRLDIYTFQETVRYLRSHLSYAEQVTQRPEVQADRIKSYLLGLEFRTAETELQRIERQPKKWYVFYDNFKKCQRNEYRFVRAVNAQDAKNLLDFIKEGLKKRRF